MKIRLPHLTLTAALLAPIGVRAELVQVNFTGIVSAENDLSGTDFSSLIAPGDAVSGALQFNFNPPDLISGVIGVTATGSYTVPAGTVLSPFLAQTVGEGVSGLPGQNFIVFANGAGVSGSVGPDTISLTGIVIGMALNGFTATLPNYLALTPADLTLQLFGNVDFGNGVSAFGPVADVNLRAASFTIVNTPDGGGTAALFGGALFSLAMLRQRWVK